MTYWTHAELLCKVGRISKYGIYHCRDGSSFLAPSTHMGPVGDKSKNVCSVSTSSMCHSTVFLQALALLNEVPLAEMGPICRVLSKTKHEGRVPTSLALVAPVINASPPARRFIWDGLNYTMQNGYLTPPKDCRHTLNSACLVAYGVSHYLLGGDCELSEQQI